MIHSPGKLDVGAGNGPDETGFFRINQMQVQGLIEIDLEFFADYFLQKLVAVRMGQDVVVKEDELFLLTTLSE